MFALDHQNVSHAAIGFSQDVDETVGLMLRYYSRIGYEWQSEIVSDEPVPYDAVNLAFDSADTPHIACLDPAGFRIYKREGMGWHSEITETEAYRIDALMFDSLDRLHVMIETRNYELKHGILIGSSWTYQTIDTDSMSARAAMGSDDLLRLTYFKEDGIYYATVNGDGSGVQKEVVEPSVTHTAQAFTLDSADNPHLAYSIQSTMYYAHRSGTSWQHEIVDHPCSGNAMSIAVDQGIIHVIILDSESKFYHLYRETTTWNSEQLDKDLWDPVFCWLFAETGTSTSGLLQQLGGCTVSR